MTNNSASQEYNYTNSGIDNFLNRSIDQVTWQSSLDASLNMPGYGTLTTLPSPPANNAVQYDATQVSGALGNTLAVGNVNINGSDGNITLSDGVTNRLLIGTQQDGF